MARHADTLLHQTSLIDDLASSTAFTQPELNGIDCPVLVICGEHSDVRDWAERLVNVVPACELHLYEGCTHLVVLEAPATPVLFTMRAEATWLVLLPLNRLLASTPFRRNVLLVSRWPLAQMG